MGANPAVYDTAERSPVTGALRTDDGVTNYTGEIVIDDGEEVFWRIEAHWETTSEISPGGDHAPHAHITVSLEWDEVNGIWMPAGPIPKSARGDANDSLFFPAVR